MGLDLIVEACAKPGHAQEWRRLLERAFAEQEPSPAEVELFHQISVPAYERLGAPRVGFDAAADAWIVEVRQAKTPDEVAAVLKEFHGYHVVRLVKCDGVPAYSNGGAYEGADETSFRGEFFNVCLDVLPENLLAEAWNSKMPEAAVAYGHMLLTAANLAEVGGFTRHRGLLERWGWKKSIELPPLSEQLDIVRSAGRWYVFWGERGHAIRAWF